MPSSLETEFELLWDALYPDIDLWAQHQGIPNRKYAFDYAHLPSRVAIEIQGSQWQKGGHNSGHGLQRDCEKSCLAAAHGWVVMPLVAPMISEEWLQRIKQTIDARSNDPIN